MKPGTFFDLHRNLTTNPEFIAKISKLMTKLSAASAAGDRDIVNDTTKQVLQLCEYNPGLLVPYFFPKFSEGNPMTLWSRPHAFSMMGFTFNGSLTVQASRQVGKCVHGDTGIMTNKGPTTLAALFETAKSCVDKNPPPADSP